MKFSRFLNAANVQNTLPINKQIAILQIISRTDFFKLISILRCIILPSILFQQLLNVKKMRTLPHIAMQISDDVGSEDFQGNTQQYNEKEQLPSKTVLALSFNSLIVSHVSNSSLLIKAIKLRKSLTDCNLKGKYQILVANALFKEYRFSELTSLIPMSGELQPYTALLLSKACMHTQDHQNAKLLCELALKPIFQKYLKNMRLGSKTPLIMTRIRTTYEALLKCMSTFFKTHQFADIQTILFPTLKQFFIEMSSGSNHEICLKFNINVKDGLLQLIKGWSKNKRRADSMECYQLAQQYIQNVRKSDHEISLFSKKASCLRTFIECQLASSPKFQLQNMINQIFQINYKDLDISCYGSAIRIITQSHNEKISINILNDLISRVQTALLQSSNPLFDKSEKIIENSKRQIHKMPMVQIAINQHLDVLVKKGKMNQALNLFNGISEILCKTQIYPSSAVPFNQILQALMRTGQVRRGWDFFEEKIYQSGIKIDSFTLSALAKGITKESHAQNLDRLLKIIDQQFNKNRRNQSEQEKKVEIIVFNVIMLACINIHQPQRAVQVFKMLNFQQDYDLDKLRKNNCFKDPENLVLQRSYTPIFNTLPDIVSYNTLIKASLKSQKFNSALSFYELLKFNNRVKANDVTYNTLIDGCTKTPHQMYLGWELLEEMCKNNIQPDSFTYSSLVKGIKKYGNNSHSLSRYNNKMNGLDSALKFLNSLLTQGIQNQAADQVLYNSVMDTCIHFKKFDKALELFTQMKERKIDPSSITYGILIKGFGQSRQINKAIQIYEEMSRKHLQPNQVTYGCLIDACVNNNKMSKAIELFNSLQEASYNSPVKGANTIIYTTLIKGFTRQRDLDSALQLYYQMKDQANPNCEPNNVTFNSLIDCCVRVGNLKVAGEIWKELQNHPKLKPDLITFSTMIKGYCQNGMIAVAFEMLDNMIAKYNITPDEVLFNSLLDGCFRSDAYDIGNMVFERMRSANLLMTEISYSIMIKMYGKQAEIDKAFGLLQELKQKRMNAGVILYTCLIKACFQQQEYKRAIEAFQMFKQEGNTPDQVVYQTMIQGLLFAGKNFNSSSNKKMQIKEHQLCLSQAGEYTVEAFDVYGVCIVQDLREQLLDILRSTCFEQSEIGKFKVLINEIERIGKMSGPNSSYYDKSYHYDRQSINHVYHHHKKYSNGNKGGQGFKRGIRKSQNFHNYNHSNSFQVKKKYSKPMYVKKEPVSLNIKQSNKSQEEDEEEVKALRFNQADNSISINKNQLQNAPLQRQDYQNILEQKRFEQNVSKKGGFTYDEYKINSKENQGQYENQQNSHFNSTSSGKFKYYNKISTGSEVGSKKKVMKFNQHNKNHHFKRL